MILIYSEHTGKMCTRSLRCPQHSDSQRKSVRAALLSTSHPQQPLLAGAIGMDSKDNNSSKEMIDVDTWDEQGDSLASLLTAQVILFFIALHLRDYVSSQSRSLRLDSFRNFFGRDPIFHFLF